MGRIHILSESISNKIAAGEVVERPASVVKELIENSIDSGSTSITVEIRDGGIAFIRVTDNGSGMDADDAKVSFIRHSTSKINCEEDLNSIKTLGFRGEALASIASVSQIEMLTKTKENTYGTKILIDGGIINYIDNTGCADGTTLIVKNLFFNTPARLKFLKNESREAAVISEIMTKLALSEPLVSFKYINNGKIVFSTPGDGNLKNIILVLYGKDVYNSLIDVSYIGNILSIKGFIGKPDIARSNRNHQTFFINNRYIKNKTLSTAVDNAYRTFLTINKFAMCILYISICPEMVDINVHPTKAEVRFQDDKEIFSSIFNTVRNGLAGEVLIPDLNMEAAPKYDTEQQTFIKSFSGEPVLRETNDERYTTYPNSISSNNLQYKETNLETRQYVEDIKAQVDEIQDYQEYSGPNNLLPPLTIIGQCQYTYILAQGPDALYIIDQHAAHERILYESFKNLYDNGSVEQQQLITPFIIEVTSEEFIQIKDNSAILTKLGFEFEYFGNNSVMLRSVPVLFGQPQLKKMFLEIVDMMEFNSANANAIINKMLYTMACKAAVKANDKLSNMEMEEIINKLRLVKNPYTCPHGRPTIIKLTTNELEKRFKRIQ